MSRPFRRLRQFFRELKRRNVYQVAATYAVVGFILIQVGDLTFVRLGLPSWTVTFLIVLVAMGFPLALIVAWAFEMTPEGVRRTPQAEVSEADAAEGGGGTASGYRLLVLIGLVAAAVAGGWYLTGGAGTEPDADDHGSLRIAVLPFESIGADGGDAAFARGMREELLNQLATVSALEIVSGESGSEAGRAEMTASEIGRELDVTAFLNGSVRRAGDRLRITTRLVDADRDAQLWSDTYDRAYSVEAVFEIQAEIARQITSSLEAEFTEDERRAIAEPPTTHLAAYDAFLRGRAEWGRIWRTLEPAHADSSIVYLRRAVSRDSSFVQAQVWLGRAYRARRELTGEARWLDSAAVWADRARSIAPDYPGLHLLRGGIYRDRDSLEAAEVAYQRAVEERPNDADATHSLAVLYAEWEKWPEVIRWAHRSVRLNPELTVTNLTLAEGLMRLGFLDRARAWVRRAGARDPGSWWTISSLARLHLLRGAEQAARDTLETFLEEHPAHRVARSLAAEAALYAGEGREAKEYLTGGVGSSKVSLAETALLRSGVSLETADRMHLGWAEIQLGNRGRELLAAAVDSLRGRTDRSPGSTESSRARLAAAEAAVGRREEALENLASAVRGGFSEVEWLETYPLFTGVRTSPRFRELIDSVRVSQERLRERVSEMDLDLSPPGVRAKRPSGEAAGG